MLAQTVNVFPYAEDFENGQGNWTSGGSLSSWALGTPAAAVINTAAPGGTNSWATNLTGTFNGSEASFVESPPLDFSNLVAPALNLDVWWDSEFGWSATQVQTSNDGGTTWTTLGDNTTGVNWYNNDLTNGAGGTFFNGSGGDDSNWSGEDLFNQGSGGWVTAAHELTGLAGQSNVRVRVVFGSDAVTGTDGFAFDNVLIGEGDDIQADSIMLSGQVCEGLVLPIQVRVCNVGLAEQSNFPVTIEVNGMPTTLTVVNPLAPGDCYTVIFNGAT
ncbi:MAG: hypothetical protein AAGB22_13920, partial [Bacteroidota bacterium]